MFRYLFLSIIFLLFGCAGVQTTSVQTTQKDITQIAKYQGPKARIAVARFECKAAKCYRDIGDGLKDMLIDALLQTDRFIVLERGEGFEALKEEIDLAQSGYIQQRQAPEKGLMEGADIIVLASIVAFEPNAGGVSGGVGALLSKVPMIGGVKIGKQDAYIAAIIRLVDVRTGRILSSTRVEGKASSFKIGGLGGWLAGSVGLGGGLEVYKNTPMEKAVMVLIDNAVKEIVKHVPESYYRYSPTGKEITPQKN
jgi:curli biogenesis system outer membrane secretion channel CsgG